MGDDRELTDEELAEKREYVAKGGALQHGDATALLAHSEALALRLEGVQREREKFEKHATEGWNLANGRTRQWKEAERERDEARLRLAETEGEHAVTVIARSLLLETAQRFERERNEARLRLEEVTRRLVRYGRHDEDCTVMEEIRAAGDCSCGLDLPVSPVPLGLPSEQSDHVPYPATPSEPPQTAEREKPKRSCNRHDDCTAADAVTLAEGGNPYVSHCHSDDCEDCFGC